MKTENAYSSKELSPTTWPDFEALFAKHNGVSMFGDAGFDVASQPGKSSVVMRKFV
jgi:hypothetical protein